MLFSCNINIKYFIVMASLLLFKTTMGQVIGSRNLQRGLEEYALGFGLEQPVFELENLPNTFEVNVDDNVLDKNNILFSNIVVNNAILKEKAEAINANAAEAIIKNAANENKDRNEAMNRMKDINEVVKVNAVNKAIDSLLEGVSGITVSSLPFTRFSDINVRGDMPVEGSAILDGSLPVVGYVNFKGLVPANGVVNVASSSGSF